MTIFNPKKTVTPGRIACKGTATVTLSFDATAELAATPTDIVLIMDRSSSMDPSRMYFARRGADSLISTVAGATTEDPGGNIGMGSRIGIVSFSTEATQDLTLTAQRPPMVTAIASLRAGGETNYEAAFEAAKAMLGPKGTNRQVAVMFTDGLTTMGGDATGITAAMKAAGVEIYCIGLVENPELLNCWASEPVAEHVAYTADQNHLTEIFNRIASRIVLAGARNIVIRETLSPEFRIRALNAPTRGVAAMEDPQTLVWTMEYAGISLNPETVSLRFEIEHIGTTDGIKAFNQAVTYHDQAGTELKFPTPTIEIQGTGGAYYPEPCPAPTAFTVDPCQDALRTDLKDAIMTSLGRIVQVNVVLKAVCPGKRVAVSVMLTELGPDGIREARGVKHVLVPAQTGKGCRDVELNCIQFSLPEELDPTGAIHSICNARNFEARVIANYVDTDFTCCDTQEVPIC